MKLSHTLLGLLAAGALLAAPTSGQERAVRLTAAPAGVTITYGGHGLEASARFGRHGLGGIGLRTLHPAPRAGHFELQSERVWVPGRTETVWIEPVYREERDACGIPYRVLVRGGHWERVEHPGHYELRTVRVWVPDYGRHHDRRR